MSKNLLKLLQFKSVFLFLLIICVTGAFAQSTTISGKVTDASDKSPIIGASILVKGTTTGAQTDVNGIYHITLPSPLPKSVTLVVSFIGYKSIEVDASGKSTQDVVLSENNSALKEVVVVGYGTQRKGNVTNAQSRITSKNIADRPVSRVEDALAGQLPGVDVQQVTGEPGQDLSIRVRGTGSITGSNDPLYVVDGVPVDNMRGINPADVASIDVLKDASSAAIYGSRGSNGVVLVTTKRGAKGQPRINFSARTAWQSLEKKVNVLSPDQWINFATEGINEQWVAYGKTNNKNFSANDPIPYRIQQYNLLNPTKPIQNASEQPTLIPDPRWFSQAGRDSLALIDWQDAFYRVAPMQDYQLGVSGGTDDFNFNISGGYTNQQGIATGTNFQRGTLRANFDAKIGKRFKIGLTLAPSLEYQDGGRVDGKGNASVNILSIAPVAEKNAGVYEGVSPYANYAWGGSIVSPLAYIQQTTNYDKRNVLNSSMYLNADIANGLQLQLTGAYNTFGDLNQVYIPTSVDRAWATSAPGSLSSSTRSTASTARYLFQSILNYTKSFGNHNFSGLLGFSAEKTTGDNTYEKATGFANDFSYYFNSTTSKTTSAYIPAIDPTGLVSYFSRIQYDYKGKYLLSASFRADGSSKFGSNNKYGYYPAISGGWRISEEPFFKSIDWMQEVKARVSYGVTGNNRFSQSQYALLGQYNYSTNGGLVYGSAAGNAPNPDLSWERNASLDFGLDFAVFKGRISVSADYYNRTTDHLLLNAPISSETGFSSSITNIGKMSNKGFETQIITQNIVNKPFHWSSTFNLSYNQNQVLALNEGNTPIPLGFGNLTQIIEVGQPFNSFIMYKAIGVYKDQNDVNSSPHMTNTQPGDVKYEDVDHNGVIDANDRTILGSPQPKFIYGFINNFSYKKFDLTIVMNAQTGGKTYAILGRSLDKPGVGFRYNIMDRWQNRWISSTQPGDGSTPSMNSTTSSLYDSRWLYSSNYLRIRNITLGYNVPKMSWFASARLYASVENVFKWDNYYGGYSPELNNDAGGDFGGYPIARTISFGITLSL